MRVAVCPPSGSGGRGRSQFELRQSFLIRTVIGLLGEELPEVSSPVGRVAALVPFHPAVFQCQNPLDDTVEGMADMGDDQHRAL